MFEDPLFWVFVGPGPPARPLCAGAHQGERRQIRASSDARRRHRRGSGRRLLDAQGLQDVKIESTEGVLSDHYDPRAKVLRLSQKVYYTPSVAAAGIAAHETGHALQDAQDYFPMEARTYIVPVVQLASQIAPLGLRRRADAAMEHADLDRRHPVRLVLLLRAADAAGRVQRIRARQGALGLPRHHRRDQIEGVDKVLDAAAWTYVAAAVSAVGVWLFYIFMLLGPRPQLVRPGLMALPRKARAHPPDRGQGAPSPARCWKSTSIA